MTDFVANGKYAPIVYGNAQGFFEGQGIDLDLQYGRGSGITAQAVAAGQADIGIVDSGIVAKSVKENFPIVAVGLFTGKNNFAFFVPRDSDIRKPTDLVGKDIIVAPGTPQDLVGPAVLGLAGVDVKDVNIVAIEPKLTGSSYANGKGDAIGEAITYSPIFEENRPSRAFPWAEVGYTLPGFAFVVGKSMLADKPDVVARFLTAMYKSMGAALDDPKAAIAEFAAQNRESVPERIANEFNYMRPFYCSDVAISEGKPLGYQPTSDWEKGVAVLEKAGILPEGMDPASIYTDELFDNGSVDSPTCKDDWGGEFSDAFPN